MHLYPGFLVPVGCEDDWDAHRERIDVLPMPHLNSRKSRIWEALYNGAVIKMNANLGPTGFGCNEVTIGRHDCGVMRGNGSPHLNVARTDYPAE